MENDGGFGDRALRRIYWLMLAVGGAGAVFACFWRDWSTGLGFAIGSGASYLNFRWLHQTVDAVTPGRGRPGRRLGILLCFRYLVLGFGSYAILKIFGLNLLPVLLGLFVPAAAIIFEILYELTLWDTKNSG